MRVPLPRQIETGCTTRWTESEWDGTDRHGQHNREDCPNGCANRDIETERKLGLNICCLRCMTHTFDRKGKEGHIPINYILLRQEQTIEDRTWRLTYRETKYCRGARVTPNGNGKH